MERKNTNSRGTTPINIIHNRSRLGSSKRASDDTVIKYSKTVHKVRDVLKSKLDHKNRLKSQTNKKPKESGCNFESLFDSTIERDSEHSPIRR